MAGVLTPDRSRAATREVAGALIGMRRTLERNAPGGSGVAPMLRVVGTFLALGSLLLGLVRYDDPDRSVDLLAALSLGWLAGWIMGPVAVRGAGQSLRPEWFALLPIPPRRLATGLLVAAFFGAAPLITLIAFTALPVTAARYGAAAVAVAVAAALAQLVLVVTLSRVVVAAMTATLNSRRGQELGGLLMAVVIALASGGWSLATVVGQQLATGPGPVLSTTLRVLPSGWGAVAVGAAARSDWLLAAAALAGLAALGGLLLGAWARLLARIMRRPGGRPARTARPGPVRHEDAGGRPRGWQRLLPASPTGAVVAKELHAWRRDTARTLLLVLALLISALNLAVPGLIFHAPAVLPWVGVSAALIVSTGAANVYGEDGTALWLTRMVPGTERADVRGRQLAWLLVVAPLMVALTVVLTALSGDDWAWIWVLAVLPPVLAGTPGLMALVSVTRPVRQKDPHRRSGPFDTGDDPATAGALAARGYLMLLLVALTAVPGAALVLLGDQRDQPLLQVAGVLAGVAVGGLLYWWGGRVGARRLAADGAELMDLLHVGPQALGRARQEPEAPRSRGREAAVGVLWTAGMICVVPQGLVPVAFNLFGVDPEVRVWFAARYLPQGLQLLAATGFVAAGLLLIWWAEAIRRRPPGRTGGTPGS